MIDLESEQIVTPSQAARHPLIVASNGGKPTHICTINRWWLKGTRGVTLESVQTPSGRRTSNEAIVRFFRRLSGQDATAPTPQQRADDHARAERRLAAAGL